MGLEIAFLLALLTNRTLVLPPKAQAVLTPGETGYEDFYSVDAMKSFVSVLTWDEFRPLGARLEPSRGAPSPGSPAASDIQGFCRTTHRRPKQRAFCLRSAEARMRARQVEWKLNKIILPFADGAEAEGGALHNDFEAYRRDRVPAADPLLESLEEEHWVHFPQNLFGLYYQVVYLPPSQRKAAFRAVRDGLRLQPHLEAMADAAVEALFGSQPFNAIHYRRGDFKGQFDDAVVPPEKVVQNYLSHAGGGGGHQGAGDDKAAEPRLPVYVATDERDEGVHTVLKVGLGNMKTFADLIEPRAKGLEQLRPHEHGVLEMLICARAAHFTGSKMSTFSAYITRLRGYRKKTSDKRILFTDTAYQPGEQNQEAKPYSWNVHGITRMGDFRGARALWAREYPEAWEL